MKGVAAFLSIVLHAALIAGMSALPDTKSVAAPKLVEMKVVKKEPPPPPPPKEEVKAETPKPPPEVQPKLVKKRTVEKVVADEPKPAPKSEPPPPENKPQIPPGGFSVDMSATVEGGGVAVTAVEGGGNMFANPDDKSKAPGSKTNERPREETGRGRGTAPAGAYQITRPAEFTGDEKDRIPNYPPSAKDRGIEGQVLIRVLVGKQGQVVEAHVKKRLDPACDAEALKTVKERFRFKPAMAGDEPVEMWIEVSVVFVIER